MDPGAGFEDIRDRHVRDSILWEDPVFPARNKSINPYSDSPGDWLWRRPKEVCNEPPTQFTTNTQSSDLAQGETGDTWLTAAIAVLSTRSDLLEKVVPSGQGFGANYGGIFRFNLWHFGEWRDVMVDDKLPVTGERELRFTRDRASNNLWAPLLEKAFAKVYGSYSDIASGQVQDALVDMTGGVAEEYNLRQEEKVPPNLYEIIKSSHEKRSLIVAGIWGESAEMREELMWNGLYRGHGYSITGTLEARVKGWSVKLLRIRNPWADKGWTGPWGEGSEEWSVLTEEERKSVGLDNKGPTEFWMSYEEFLKNFHVVLLIHIDSTEESNNSQTSDGWHVTQHKGKWVSGVNAGGSGLLAPNKDLYFINPQYYIQLDLPDHDDIGEECTCVISTQQKVAPRGKGGRKPKLLNIGFDVHHFKVKTKPEWLDANSYFDKATLKKQYNTRSIQREVSCRFTLPPGTYCVIPVTATPKQEGEFLLRTATYCKVNSSRLDEEELHSKVVKKVERTDKPIGRVSFDAFKEYAGDENVLDARDLRDLLMAQSKTELEESISFSVDSCRSLITMFDTDGTGDVDFDDTVRLWDTLLYWKGIFDGYDRDGAGCIETYELRRILPSLGYKLSLETLSALAVRYGGKDRQLFFEDFILCLAKTTSLYALFEKFSDKDVREAQLSLDQWLQSITFL